MINILFICSGDTCRSPMAAAILRDKVIKKGIKNIKCASCGINVDSNQTKLNDNSKTVLKMLNIRLPRHKARQCSHDILAKSDYAITMTFGQKKLLIEEHNDLKNVYCLAEFINGVDVFDPYGKGESAYLEAARYLDFATDQILERLYKEKKLKLEK